MRSTSILNTWLTLLFAMAFGLWSAPARALPVFARRENVGCPVCHTAFPELNAAGRSYKENGYRFPGASGEEAKTPGTDMGNGVVVDGHPGIAFRVVGIPFIYGPSGTDPSTGELSTAPLDAAELIAAGNTGKHWSYMAEIATEAENGYATEGNGLVQYTANGHLTLYTGWTPPFSRDGYNSLSESRQLDHVDHGVQGFEGSIGIPMSEEAGQVGAYGRAGGLFYMAMATPGPGIVPGVADPLDYMGRVAYDLNKKVAVGAFVYEGATSADSTTRAAVDLNIVSNPGNVKLVVMMDTLDQSEAFEAGWDMVKQVKNVGYMPIARVDAQVSSAETIVQPMVGFAVQQSGGRVQLEVSDPLGGSTTVSPTAQLVVDGVF